MSNMIDFEFEDLSPMIGGVEYGRGFCGRGTLEWDEDGEEYVVMAISLDAEASGKPPLNLVRNGDHRQWFSALADAVVERFQWEIEEASAEMRVA